MTFVRTFFNVLALATMPIALAAQPTILNGNFEINTAGVDQINITNSQFNAYMSNCTGFGTYAGVGNLDIVRTATYGLGPQNGTWYIAMTGGDSDRATFQLSGNLIAGNTYTLNFYDNGWSSFFAPPIMIGVSNNNLSIGTVAFTSGAPSSASWTLRTHTFVAPATGNFLGVQTSGAFNTSIWTKMDNFFFSTVLPVKSVVMNAERVGKSALVSVKGELTEPTGIDGFFLERSLDGGEFVDLGEVELTTRVDGAFTFEVQDELKSFDYQDYRLRLVDADGQATYTETVRTEVNAVEPEFILFPNPSKGKFSVLYHHPVVGTPVSIEVYDLQGKLLHAQELDRLLATQEMDLQHLDPGLYLVNLVSGAYRESTKLVIE